jgi:hypothetical protein
LKSIPHPPGNASRPIEVPIVDKDGTVAVGLRQQKHHAVDVLLANVYDRDEDSAPRQIRDESIAADVERILAREIKALIQHTYLTLLGEGDEATGIQPAIYHGRRYRVG